MFEVSQDTAAFVMPERLQGFWNVRICSETRLQSHMFRTECTTARALEREKEEKVCSHVEHKQEALIRATV